MNLKATKLFDQKNTYKLFIAAIVLINVAVFILVNAKPIVCKHNEITHINFLWSTSIDKPNPYLLHSGLQKLDFNKIFLSNQLEDGLIRFRQFSYLVDMVLFKCWQGLGITTFHNPTLILLHLFNVILLYFCLKAFPLDKSTALLCSLLLLNSSPALSSLLFPFRIYKMLLIFLFLTTWIAGNKIKSPLSLSKQDFIFCFLLLLMLFTDEMALFFILILYMNLYFQKKLSLRKIAGHLAVVLICFSILAYQVVSMERHYGQFLFNATQGQLFVLKNYLTYLKTYSDLLRAFIFYFLRRQFGYWDFSIWGIMSFMSFSGLLLAAFLNITSKLRVLASLGFIFLILLKSTLFPLPSGVLHYIMGDNTFFPTVLFFNYYYTYTDSILIILAVGVLINTAVLKNKQTFMLILALATVINISNGIHADEGIRDARNQHGYYQTGYRNIPKIILLDQLKPLAGLKPIYLSFPSGSQPVFKRFLSSESVAWRLDPLGQQQNLLIDFIDYASIIPVQYLKMIESGKFIISLQNVTPLKKPAGDGEILSASLFYDVFNQKWIDLSQLTASSAKENSLIISNGHPINRTLVLGHYQKVSDIIFFIKGGAQISATIEYKYAPIKIKNKRLEFRQNYGYSYQAFDCSLKNLDAASINKIYLTIVPAAKDESIALWGPFAAN